MQVSRGRIVAAPSDGDVNQSVPRFRLKTLLVFVACVAAYSAAVAWVIRAETLDSSRFPFLFMHS